MGLFKRARREYAVTTLLRHMERGRFAQALKALQRNGLAADGPVPPPHALWRLGRWSLEKAGAKAARKPLRMFLEYYPAHEDRPEVMRDLARALALSGRRREAAEMAELAESSGRTRDDNFAEQRARDRASSGRRSEPAPG